MTRHAWVWSMMFACMLTLRAQAEETLPLYPGAIPGAIEAPDTERVRDPKDPNQFLLDVSRPLLSVYLPPKPDAKRAAVLIFPGGGYVGLSVIKEGSDIARAFNALGVAAIVVKYRTPNDSYMRDKKTGPLQDAQQAMRVVRSNAAKWGIDPARVGVVGFSAGGHLAATAATQFDNPVIVDVSAPSLRPDFAVLLYPVISFADDIAHSSSRIKLLGLSPEISEVERFSAEKQVTANTPPAMIMHAADDKTVPVTNSVRFFEALTANKVPAELMIYPRGGHGFGLNNATTRDRWIDRCAEWLRSEGLLSAGR